MSDSTCTRCGRHHTGWHPTERWDPSYVGWTALAGGVCNLCRGRAIALQAAKPGPWRTESRAAVCVECAWDSETAFLDDPTGSADPLVLARNHIRDTGHGVLLRRLQERLLPGRR